MASGSEVPLPPWQARSQTGPVRRKRIWDPTRGLNWSGRPSRTGSTTGSRRQPDSPGVPGCFRARTMRRSPSLVSMTKSVKSTKSNKSTRSARSGRSARSARSTRSTRAARAARAKQVALRKAARDKPLPPLPGLPPSCSYAHAPLPPSHAPSVPGASAVVPTSNSAPVRLYVRTDGAVGESPLGRDVVLVADLCPGKPRPYISFEIPTTPSPTHQPDHTHSRSTQVTQAPSTIVSSDPARPVQTEASLAQCSRTNQSPSRGQVLDFTHLSEYPARSSSRKSNSSDHSDASDTSLATEDSEGHVMQATRLNRAQIAAGQLSAYGSSTSLAEVKRPTSQATQPLHGQATEVRSSPSLDIAPEAFEPLWQGRASSAPESSNARESLEILDGPSHTDSHHDTLANPDTVLGRMLNRAQSARSSSTPDLSGHGPPEVQDAKRSLLASPSTQYRTSVETSHVRSPSDVTASSTTHATARTDHRRSTSIESLGIATSPRVLGRVDPASIVPPSASAPSELTHALGPAKLKQDAKAEAKITGQNPASFSKSPSKLKQTASPMLGCVPKSGHAAQWTDELVQEDPWVQEPKSQVRAPSSRSIHKRSSNQSTHLCPPSERRKQKGSTAVKALLELLDRQTSAVDAMQAAYAEAHKVQSSELHISEKILSQARAQIGTLLEELATVRSQLDAAAGLQSELEEAREDAIRARAETLRTKALLHEAQQEVERRAGRERELQDELLALRTHCPSPDPNSHGFGNHTFGGDDPESSGSTDRNSTHLSVSPGDMTPEQLATRRQRPTLVNQLVQLQEEHRHEIARLQLRHAAELAQARELGRRTRSAWLMRTQTPSPSYLLDHSDNKSGTQFDTEPKSAPLSNGLTGLGSPLGSAHGSDLLTPTAEPVRSASASAVSSRGAKGRPRSKRSYPLKLDTTLSTSDPKKSKLLVPESPDLSTEDLAPQLQVSAPSNHSLTALKCGSKAQVSLSFYPLRLAPSSIPPQSQQWPTSSSPILPSTPSSAKSEPLCSER